MKLNKILGIARDRRGIAPLIIVVLGAILAAALAGGGIWWWHNLEIKKQNEETDKKIAEIKALKKKGDEEKNKASELKELDKNWNLYTNYKLGFSLKVPKFNYSYEGSCKWVGGSDKSYRPESALVPVTYLEDGDSVYIAASFYYKLGGEKKYGSEAKGYTYKYSTCDKTTTTLDLLKDENEHFSKGWHITIKTVSTDGELTKIIQDQHGKGCSIGTKKASGTQEGVFDVEVEGDGKELDETKCPINYAYIIKYYPEKHLVAYWDLGQSNQFADQSQNGLDEEMVKSFKFN